MALRAQLFRRVDIAGLVFFRVMFGALMAFDALRYISFGWVRENYGAPHLTFKFFGFGWVETLSSTGMHAVFGLLAAAAAAIALGFFYRASCALFFLLYTYVFLTAAESYLNHAYLIALTAALLGFLPAHRALSLDVLRRPALHTREVHFWAYGALLGTLTIVYVYGAFAKMNADWLVGYEPIRHWIADRAATADGTAARLLLADATPPLVAWGGTAFDLLIAPALMWRRTRILATIASVGFHLANNYLFYIGIFPWMMIAATTLFFEPSWPRRLYLGKLLDFPGANPARSQARASEIRSQSSRDLSRVGTSEFRPGPAAEGVDPLALSPRRERAVVWGLAAFAALMLLVPLRHYLYPGDVAWTEEGHLFSWRMKLRDKRGRVSLRVRDRASGRAWVVDPNTDLLPRQVVKMVGRPELLLQYVHYLRDRYRRSNGMDVEIRADVFISLNYRKEQRYIDPEVDLARTEPSMWPAPWILPFEDTALPSPVLALDSHLGRTAERMATLARHRAGPVKETRAGEASAPLD